MSKINKAERLKEILSSSWSTLKRLENGVRITGFRKDDFIEINESEIKLVYQLIKANDSKIRLGAIEILGEFGKVPKSYIMEIIEGFLNYTVMEQKSIIHTINRIVGSEIVELFNEMINKNLDYDILLEIAFTIGLYLDEKPHEGLKTLTKLSVNKDVWSIISSAMLGAVNRGRYPDKYKGFIAQKLEEPPLIGISEEGQKRKDMISSIESRIDLAIMKLAEIEKEGENKKERSEAKKTIDFINKKVK